MSELPNAESAKAVRQPRAFWQYCIAGLMFAGAGWLLVRPYFPGSPKYAFVDRADPLPIRVDPKLETADRVPLEPGALAGSNVLMVTFDTTRADRIGCYGNSAIETPFMDRLARSGVLFSRGIAVAPTTLPSHASIMTGLNPFRHGARANANYRLANDHVTCAEILQDRGYATGAFISTVVLEGSFGLSQGFSEYMDDLTEGVPAPLTGDLELPGNKTTDRAIEWLSNHSDAPFFAWVHLYDPHSPHKAPPPYDKLNPFAYDGEIAFADEQLGRLMLALESKGQLDNTLVIVVGDHGESLGQHGELTHGFLVHGATLHVPMIMACGSRLGGGVCVSRPVSQIDLLPTVLSLLGIEAPADMDGIDLSREIPEDRSLYSDTMEGYVQVGLFPLAAVTRGNFRYIHGPNPELYDLSKDPFEEQNLIDRAPELAAELQGELTSLVGDDIMSSFFATPKEELDAQTRDRMAALGYLRSENNPPPGDQLFDPKTYMSLVVEIEYATTLDAKQGPEKSIPIFERIAKEHPDFAMVWRHLGNAYRKAGDLEEAISAFEQSIRLHPDDQSSRIRLAEMAMLRQDYPEAQAQLEAAIAVGSGRLDLVPALAAAYARQGKMDDAARVLIDAFKQYPAAPDICEGMVDALISTGRLAECQELLEDALAANPHVVVVRNSLARVHTIKKEYKEAVELLRAGLEMNPDSAEMITNLGLVLATSADNPDVFYPIEATVLIEKVCQKTNYTDARYVHTLSLAYSSLRRFDEGLVMAKRARKLAEDAGDQRFVSAIDQTIKRMEKSKEQGASPMHRVRSSYREDIDEAGE